MSRMLYFMFTLPLLVALAAAAMVLMELISKHPGEVMDITGCIGCKGLQL